jgi:hypothetical protein
MNAMGLFPCMSTASIPLSLASVSRVNDFEKSGIAKTGAVHMVCFRASKAVLVSELH